MPRKLSSENSTHRLAWSAEDLELLSFNLQYLTIYPSHIGIFQPNERSNSSLKEIRWIRMLQFDSTAYPLGWSLIKRNREDMEQNYDIALIYPLIPWKTFPFFHTKYEKSIVVFLFSFIFWTWEKYNCNRWFKKYIYVNLLYLLLVP